MYLLIPFNTSYSIVTHREKEIKEEIITFWRQVRSPCQMLAYTMGWYFTT